MNFIFVVSLFLASAISAGARSFSSTPVEINASYRHEGLAPERAFVLSGSVEVSIRKAILHFRGSYICPQVRKSGPQLFCIYSRAAFLEIVEKEALRGNAYAAAVKFIRYAVPSANQEIAVLLKSDSSGTQKYEMSVIDPWNPEEGVDLFGTAGP